MCICIDERNNNMTTLICKKFGYKTTWNDRRISITPNYTGTRELQTAP